MSPVLIQTPWDDREVEKLVDAAIASGSTKIKPSRMKLSDYNGFTGEQRLITDRKIKVAVDLGLIPEAKRCNVCGSDGP